MPRKIILIASLILVLVNVPAFANDEKGAARRYQQEYHELFGPSLRGLKGVCVIIQRLSSDIKEHGLTEDQIRTDTELKLRTARIRIIPKEEVSKEQGMPCLHIAVHAQHEPSLKIFSVNIDVELVQMVLLPRTQPIVTIGTTWKIGQVATIGEDVIQRIRDTIKDDVDQFINAYLTENPKQ